MRILRGKGYSPKGWQCHEHIAQMNEWGAAGCRENIEEIIDWLEEAARSGR